MKSILSKLKNTVKITVQRLIIAMQLFGENGLANHAAAGAYGFLLSVAPMLLVIVFFILVAFEASPQMIADLISNISFLDILYDEHWLTGDFFSVSMPGISGVISILGIFWAGRILALSVQRGLKIIFPETKSRNPVTDTMVTLIIETVVLLFALVLIFGSRTALRFYKAFDFFPETSVLYLVTSKISSRIFPIASLGLASFFAYLFIPVNSPRKVSALKGAIFCAVAFGCTDRALGFLINKARYNFLYGTLGNLIILLVNVSFFFTFFFLGAQLAFVIDSFDALLFLKLRQTRIKAAGNNKSLGRLLRLTRRLDMTDKLFSSVEGRLKKYFRFYEKGTTIFLQGDSGDDIYYILEGEIEIIISSSGDSGSPADILKPGSIFGEMGYLLSENRTAAARAKTNVSVLALPPPVFEEILKYDISLDRNIIEHISRRLKNTNEHIAALSSGH
jgi:membrane protein